MQHIKVKTKKNTETNRKLGWRERLKNKKSQQKKWRYGTEGGIVEFSIKLKYRKPRKKIINKQRESFGGERVVGYAVCVKMMVD